MGQTQMIGDMGEDFATEILQRQGLRIVARGYRSKYGEIDIIACDDEYICFVEVKTRSDGSMVPGEMAVDARKQRRIITTALIYLQQHDNGLQPRFDVVSIKIGKNGNIIDYDYLEGAFDASAYPEHI